MSIRGTGRGGELSVPTPRWVNNASNGSNFSKAATSMCVEPVVATCTGHVSFLLSPPESPDPACPQTVFSTPFSPWRTIPPSLLPLHRAQQLPLNGLFETSSNTFHFLPKSYLNGLCPSDESLLETWQEPLESRQTGSVNQTNGKIGQREDLGVRNEVTGPHINPSWLTTCPSKMGERFFNFASLAPRYFAEIMPDPIIKLRSRRIVRNDNSTFVIQLQINPLCSVLLHRFWYYSSILTAAYYCHTKMLPEP